MAILLAPSRQPAPGGVTGYHSQSDQSTSRNKGDTAGLPRDRLKLQVSQFVWWNARDSFLGYISSTAIEEAIVCRT